MRWDCQHCYFLLPVLQYYWPVDERHMLETKHYFRHSGRGGRAVPVFSIGMSKCPWARYWTPNLPLIVKVLSKDAVYKYMCQSVNGNKLYCKALWVVSKTRRALYETTEHLAFSSVREVTNESQKELMLFAASCLKQLNWFCHPVFAKSGPSC